MKTTLKRGMGRAGGANGNGRPVFPPGVLAPMRRYRQPEPPHRSFLQLVGHALVWLVVILLVATGGVAGGAYLYYHQTAQALAPHSAAVKKATKELARVPPASQPANALVIGYDKRRGHDPLANGGSRSDTVMLMRANPHNHTISLLSFPRDLLVPIYCKGTVVASSDRINMAWSDCGPQGTLETVQHLTKVPIHYLVTVDFHGCKLIVNKLGGVWMDVDHRYYVAPHTGTAAIDLEAGYQKLDGGQALDFVRFRHTDSDLYRLARQQEFVEALKQRISGNFSFTALPKIVGAIKGSVEIGQGGGGAVPLGTALSYASFAYGLPSAGFHRATIDNLIGYNTLTAPQQSIDAAVQQFLNPDTAAAAKANAAALGVKYHPKRRRLKPSQISTLVLNGTAVGGLAGNTSYELGIHGYHTVQLAGQARPNAPTTGYTKTQIYFDPQRRDAKLAAQALKTILGTGVVTPLAPQILPYAQESGNPLTVVVLGTDFEVGGLHFPAPQTEQTPKHVPPSVVTNVGATLASLRSAAHRVPFTVEVPHVIATQSQLEYCGAAPQCDPIRVYKPAPFRKGIRITFQWGPFGNEYWGIEETDFTNAPALGRPGIAHTFGRRKFDFYYSGSHLHMVVLRDGNASYWVINTLLDRLSNETMIAIARGLKPLGQ
jgi:LCP family protein required for cell wall assembly